MRFNVRVSSERFDRRLCQFVCCAGAPIVFACAILTLDQFGATPAEFLIGVLATPAAAFGMIVMGCVSNPKTPAA